jgi:spore germination cell wall hydrolase CwlJ-like protein
MGGSVKVPNKMEQAYDNTQLMAKLPKNFWQGLIGEGVSEGEEGMRAIAHTYKNRLANNIDLGMVALKRKDLGEFVKKQGPKYSKMAQDIVSKVFSGQDEDPTGGSTHYENVEKFGTPKWAKGMTITKKIGAHTFFKK